ncbi:hypothetical protein EV182_000570 [Spiromyces aspiralis]|uniref:Uncharacterized protein n=1 Tax=Spiromyces aspiralis TaxID=68401 RepID=A0ACC1HKL6_9FUNG|nr:hypothetical protein EV182_000570 [Spiromyces aspiralis]
MEIEAYTPEPKRTKWQIATGADSSKSGAQTGPSTVTSGRTNTRTHHLRIGHSRAITEQGGTAKEWTTEHEREAKLVISEGCIRRDVDKVLDLLRPWNQAVAAHASRIAADIADQLDSLVLNSNEKAIEDILSWIAPPSPHEEETTMNNPKATAQPQLIEAKCSVSGEDEAFEQLLLYTRRLYALQHDRRFGWGVVVCGSSVRVCLLGPNEAVFASTVMDVATGPGRKAFVEFLVNCSFCDIDQLGLDPTMTYLKHIKCWKIECPTEDGEDGPKYVYSDEVIMAADRLFGRRTRCFLGSLDMPPEGSELKHDVVVKDSWSDAVGTYRDEVKFLREIRGALSGKENIDFEYPRLLHGGCVKLWIGATDSDSKPVFIADDTDYLYRDLPITTTTGNDGGNDDGSGGPAPMWPSREHRRIVMGPVGEPLRFVESVPELIIVLRDVMRCHGAIFNECSILHRDISTRNILVVRPESGLVRGMLIDFDCAVDTGVSEGEARTEMTGTQPFMSVLNLEDSSVKRTALDDWESLLYMVCWLGTYGINEHTQRKEADGELKKLKIRRWRYGSFNEIATDKRDHLDIRRAFKKRILANFNSNMEHCKMLTRLAAWLLGLSDDDEDLVDPFERRIEHCERISADLLGVLEKYASAAEKLIEAQQQQEQQQQQRRRLRSRRGRGAQ